jgi:hypothetical protein
MSPVGHKRPPAVGSKSASEERDHGDVSCGRRPSLAGILFVIPSLAEVLPAGISNAISPYLPSNAGQAIMNMVPQPHTLAPWIGLGVFAGYALIAIAAAAFLLVRRDAWLRRRTHLMTGATELAHSAKDCPGRLPGRTAVVVRSGRRTLIPLLRRTGRPTISAMHPGAVLTGSWPE